MKKASTRLLEQETQTPSPAPDLIPAESSTENLHWDWYSKRGHFKRSQAFFIECWIGRARVHQIPSEHPASVETQCSKFHVSRIEPKIVHSLRVEAFEKKSTASASCDGRETEAVKGSFASWEIANNKENFYRGIRILLKLQRSGSSNL